ncbi:MAG: class II aldolase/adducin family protein [Dissulfurispiraceae bacterium]|jgi:ribulose-5-phosphate 4-epimerase/fuculose-1-phosphate aldolase
MLRIINKYLDKLEGQGIAKREDAISLAFDAEMFSNKPMDGDTLILREIFDLMNISSLLYSVPSEPYRSIIQEIIKRDRECLELKKIVPMDCETRTFFHDIPVIDDFDPQAITAALSLRKSAIIRGRGIITYGALTPEQAYVSFSSTCFSAFVKYFYDALIYFDKCEQTGMPVDRQYMTAFDEVVRKTDIAGLPQSPAILRSKPPQTEDEVIEMLAEAGRAIVTCRLVDSHFGNISYVYRDHIFISQTGSFLDELEGSIDMVPLDGSSSIGITASSELSAHKNIYLRTGCNAILHGHPKFSVIMSMYCKEEGCDRSLCHKVCKQKRELLRTPIVSGEIGTGQTGLMNTVPPAMMEGRGAIVYGHGVFAADKDTFQKPFNMLMQIEENSFREYFRRVKSLLEHLPYSDPDRLAESG